MDPRLKEIADRCLEKIGTTGKTIQAVYEAVQAAADVPVVETYDRSFVTDILKQAKEADEND